MRTESTYEIHYYCVTLSGVSSEMRNTGTFWQGFASGAAASLISGAVGGACDLKKVPAVWAKAAMIAAGGIAGGVSSKIAGGEFIDGFCNGLICAGLNHALHYVAGEAWVMLRGRSRMSLVNQPDGWMSNPKYCKYCCLAMIEKYFLGDFARSAEELCEIAEDNGYDKYDLFTLYKNLSAEYEVQYLQGNKTSFITEAMLEGHPIIAGAERFSSNGDILDGHATVITGIGFYGNGYELQLADPMLKGRYNYITSETINRQYTMNNIKYEMVVFKPR